jgi:hypothetical protein
MRIAVSQLLIQVYRDAVNGQQTVHLMDNGFRNRLIISRFGKISGNENLAFLAL